MFEVVAYNGAGWENVVAIWAERGNALDDAKTREMKERANIGYFVRSIGPAYGDAFAR